MDHTTPYDVPGPGSYILPSEFGIYISSNAENNSRLLSVNDIGRSKRDNSIDGNKNNK